MRLIAKLILILTLIVFPHFAAQSVSAATLFTGIIVDREGVGIDDAFVKIEKNNQTWKFLAGKNGRFKISLPNGTFRITIERTAFKKVVTDFIISGEPSISHTFPMAIDCCIDPVFVAPSNSPSENVAVGNYRAAALAPEPNIGVNGYFASDRAQRGRIVQAAVVMEIPAGYHVNANRPLNKYSIPTSLKIDASGGVRIGPVLYPQAIVRKLKATNNEPLAVYEGRAILHFNVTVPASYQGSVSLNLHLRFQSCNDEVCFPPKTQEMNMGIDVVGPNDRVQRTNGWVFGRR
jgi:hypothetical protein